MIIFKKINFLIILFTFFVNINTYAEVINKVDVQGNVRISDETIIVFGDIVIGNDYTRSDINLLIKKLYETTFFSNISVELISNKLTINVKENAIVNSVIFKGEKTKKYTKKINELLTLNANSSFVSGNIKSDVSLIKSYYRNLGFYFVKIDADVVKLEKNKVDVIYTINKGEKAKISKIYFLGDKKIRSKKLRDIIVSQESRFWKVISKKVYLNQQIVELDKRLLKNYYINRGYYEVDLASSNVEYSEGEGFILTYSINAGKRYRFRKISAEISDALDKTAFTSLGEEFNKLVGKFYSNEKLSSVLEKIDKLSEQKELQFINHRVEETLDGNGIDVKIVIFEGKKFIIERINIAGNTVTNDSVIRGELIVDEGDPFSELLVNKSINEIKARNIFAKVERKTIPGSNDDLKILEISVEEKATGEIMAGAGIGTDGGSFQFNISENNWLGKGIRLKTGLQVSQEKLKANLAVINPNYNFTGNAIEFSFDVASTDKTGTSGYESTTNGLSIGTQFEQYENIYFSPKLSYVYEDIESETTSSAAIKKMDGTYRNLDFTYGITFDQRNQKFEPTGGYVSKFTQRLPIVQDHSSIYNSYFLNTYHDISENVLGSLKLTAKTIHGIDNDVRLTNRLMVSNRKLRGFASGKVGPKDGDDWVGGNYQLGLSAEAQLPNLLPESYKTDINIYLDAMNLWGVDYSDTVDESSEFRSSIGIGASVFTIVGPLSWTISQNLSKASTDETETVNFALGTSF